MGVSQAPFMYESVKKDDERFPGKTFDPKAVTRASYEPKKKKQKPDGPLVSFGRHPEYVTLYIPFQNKQFTFLFSSPAPLQPTILE